VHFIEIPFAVNASDYIVEMAKGNTSGPVQEDES
jgi:hypothetical protein